MLQEINDADEIEVLVKVSGEQLWVPVDTAAVSIWVDYAWFIRIGGNVLPCDEKAEAVDGHHLEVVGQGILSFELWGRPFHESVRVLHKMPDKILIGRKFWRRNKLHLDLAANCGVIEIDGTRFGGIIGKRKPPDAPEAVRKVLEGADVDRHLKLEADYSEFSTDPVMQKRLHDLLWSRREVFKGLGRIKGVKHEIVLKEDAKPLSQPLRKRSPKEQDVEREAMLKLIELGVLEPSKSPWASNNVFVRKKNGSIRVTSDFRALNDATATDSHPMEDMRSVLDWLGNKKVLSTFDLKDAFYQVEIEESSKPLTAIRTVIGLLQCTRLPQGMKNSSVTLQRIINTVLGDRKGQDVLAFMDDTSVGTETEEQYLLSLSSLLDTLLHAEVRLTLSKCKFGVRSAEILGHRVDNEGIQPSEAHVESIGRLVEPASREELMRFLGLVNFFSDFIDHFAETAAPLYEVLKGTSFSKKRKHGQKFKIHDWESRWETSQREAWQALKGALRDPEVLVAPKRGMQKRVMTDASSYGLGGVLLQKTEEGNWRPVSFTSRLMRLSERKFTATEKECLAVVHALRKWCHYLHGERFQVITDHLALRWLLSLKEPRERLARWVVDVQDFDFVVEHRAGRELVVPDTLSRDAVPKPLCQRCYKALDWHKLENFTVKQQDEQVDSEVKSLSAERVSTIVEVSAFAAGPSIQELRHAQTEEFGCLQDAADSDKRMLVDDDGLLCIHSKGDVMIVVPQSLTQDVLKFVHGSKLHGHYKVARTIAKLRKKYWWKKMVPDVVKFIQDCIHCAVSEEECPQRQAGLEIVHPRRRFDQVAIDVQTITPRTKSGNIKILVMIDVFTRFVRAVPIPDDKADTVAKVLLEDWIGLFRPMEKLISDGGTNLVSKVVKSLMEQMGIDRMQTYPWHPQANGTVERWNRTVAKDIASFMTTGDSDRDEHVALASLRYYTSINTATGMSPSQAMFGIEAFEAWGEMDLRGTEEESGNLPKKLATLHKSLLSRAGSARSRGKLHYDKTVHDTVYNIGDRVLMWSVKLGKDEGKKVVRP